MILKLPNNRAVIVSCIPLRREYSYWNRRTGGGRRFGIYKRPTDWIAASGVVVAWGRTRRDAIGNLYHKLIPLPSPHYPAGEWTDWLASVGEEGGAP